MVSSTFQPWNFRIRYIQLKLIVRENFIKGKFYQLKKKITKKNKNKKKQKTTWLYNFKINDNNAISTFC